MDHPLHSRDLSDAFFTNLAWMARRLRCHPLDLLSVAANESGVRADAHNPHGDASGLWQLMPGTAKGLGWDTTNDPHLAHFRALTAEAQLVWWEKYFAPHRGKLVNRAACYVATFLPALLGHAADPDFVLCGASGPLEWAYRANGGFDPTGKGTIQVRDLTAAIDRACAGMGARWTEIEARAARAASAIDKPTPAASPTPPPHAPETPTGPPAPLPPPSTPSASRPEGPSTAPLVPRVPERIAPAPEPTPLPLPSGSRPTSNGNGADEEAAIHALRAAETLATSDVGRRVIAALEEAANSAVATAPSSVRAVTRDVAGVVRAVASDPELARAALSLIEHVVAPAALGAVESVDAAVPAASSPVSTSPASSTTALTPPEPAAPLASEVRAIASAATRETAKPKSISPPPPQPAPLPIHRVLAPRGLAVVLSAVAGAMFALGAAPLTHGGLVWLGEILLMIAFLVAVGLGTTGRASGVLIDPSKTMSLSRFQTVVWTVLLLSAYLTIVLRRLGQPDPLDVVIDWKLWALLGISTTSLVGTPIAMAQKRSLEPQDSATGMAASALGQAPDEVDGYRQGVLYVNPSIDDARMTDMFEGDELGNTPFVDLHKLQLFFFTVIAAVCYGASLYQLVDGPAAAIRALPPMGPGMLTLLGISHVAYMGGAYARHTPIAMDAPTASAQREAGAAVKGILESLQRTEDAIRAVEKASTAQAVNSSQLVDSIGRIAERTAAQARTTQSLGYGLRQVADDIDDLQRPPRAQIPWR